MPRGKVTYAIYLDGEEHYEYDRQRDADEQFDKLVRLWKNNPAGGHTVLMVRRMTSITNTFLRQEQLTGHNYEVSNAHS